MGKPRGLPLSRAGFPASRRPARIGFHRSWSYSLSTGSHRKPCGQNVLCSIDITVMLDTTFGACPEADIKRQGVEDMTTIETTLRRRVELVDLHKGSPIPLCFVFELTDKLTPPNIRNSFSKFMVLYHILDLQALDTDNLVFAYDIGRELVLIITSSIGYPGMDTSNLELCLTTVLATFFLLGMLSLSMSQLLFIFGKELGISIGMSVARDDHRLQPHVKPYLLVYYWQVLDIFF